MTKSTESLFRARVKSSEGISVSLSVLDGIINTGDSIVFCSSAGVRTIVSLQADNDKILVKLDSAINAHDGEIVAGVADRPEVADQFEAEIAWMSEYDMLPGRQYTLVCAGQIAEATITKLKHRIEEASGKPIAANSISKHQSFIANLSLSQGIAFDTKNSGLKTSQFELEDSHGGTLARGEIRHSLRRASNIHWQALEVDKTARAQIKNQTPKIIWLTGLSASGKSTIANLIEKKLLATGNHTYLLDGDNVRQGINKDLGFTEADRVENIRRISEISKLMLDAGLIVIASFISPFRAERRKARSLFEAGEFVEVHVDASLATCEGRDPKGLYKKARLGSIRNFTGFDSPYELPEKPEIKIETEKVSAGEAATKIVEYLFAAGE